VILESRIGGGMYFDCGVFTRSTWLVFGRIARLSRRAGRQIQCCHGFHCVLRLERWQLIQGCQPEIVQKLAGRPEKGGSSWRFTVSDHFDPATFIERPNDVGRYGDATDLLDVAARDRLSVGNDGKRFKGG